MNIEILFQNGIFFSLFLSMISFWGENISSIEAISNENSILSTKGSEPEKNFPGTRAQESTNPKNATGFPIFLENLPEKFFQVSFFLITFELFYRWFASNHPPLSNLYESLLFLLWGVIGFFLFLGETSSNSSQKVSLSPDVTGQRFLGNPLSRNFLGCLLSSTALFIDTFADWRLPNEMREIKPLIPALQSNWLLMHVSIMILSYAALLIGCIIAITYIVIDAQQPHNSSSLLDLPSLGSMNAKKENDQEVEKESTSQNSFLTELDSLSYRILAFGFPLLTLGILSGAVWANEAWGSYWSWDPKETWAFITWLVFAFYLHTRLQYGWEGKNSAFVATFGFFVVWICYLGVNLLGKGLHSYGWLS